MRDYRQREISDVPDNELRSVLLKSLSSASQFTQLFYVVANHIAKARGENSAYPTGSIVPRDIATGFALGEFEITNSVQGRVSDLMHELSRRGYIVPGAGNGLNNDFPFYRLTERGKKLIQNGSWPGEEQEPNGQHIGQSLVITPKVFKISNTQVDPNLVSVMMPFDAAFTDVYGWIITACKSLQLECKRADSDGVWEHPELINDIVSLIFHSRIVVVDITGRNPNVMYEMGVAHAFGREVIPISQSTDKIPFDFGHHRILGYDNSPAGHQKLKDDLKAKLTQLKTKPN